MNQCYRKRWQEEGLDQSKEGGILLSTALVITFNRNTTVLMGQLWKQRLLKLLVSCKAQIPEKPVAAFDLRLCQHIPCDTAWQTDSPSDHFTLSLSSKAVTGHKPGTEPFLSHHVHLPVPAALIEQHISLGLTYFWVGVRSSFKYLLQMHPPWAAFMWGGFQALVATSGDPPALPGLQESNSTLSLQQTPIDSTGTALLSLMTPWMMSPLAQREVGSVHTYTPATQTPSGG